MLSRRADTLSLHAVRIFRSPIYLNRWLRSAGASGTEELQGMALRRAPQRAEVCTAVMAGGSR